MFYRLFTLIFTILFVFQVFSASAYDIKVLDSNKVCEPSAALFVKCTGPDRDCLAVGDNELRQKLFLYSIDKKWTRLKKTDELSFEKVVSNFKDSELSDIEAFARGSQGDLVVFGSHSRNKKCEVKKKRRIFFHGKPGSEGIQASSIKAYRLSSKKRMSCKRLFGKLISKEDGARKRFCKVLQQVEAAADEAHNKGDKEACKKAPAFNIEGAVYVKDSSGKNRLWVGLRSPLVDGKSVLLRMIRSRDKFKFDAIAFVNTHGCGIRALERSGRMVWGIGGTESDSLSKHLLWKFDARMLDHGKILSITRVANDLPNKSEGLAIKDNRAVVLIDGKDGNGQCIENGRYYFLNLKKVKKNSSGG